MSVSTVKREGSECILTGNIVPEQLQAASQKRINEIASKANLPGFRKGRVPHQHIRGLYGASIQAEVVEQLISTAVEQAITEHDLTLLQKPQVKHDQNDQAGIDYTVTFEALPQMPLVSLEKLSIKGCKAELGEAEVKEALLSIQTHFAKWEVVSDRKSKLGDRLTIDYLAVSAQESAQDQQPADADKLPKNQHFILGKHQMSEAFDKHLVGKYAGDTVKVLIDDKNKAASKGASKVYCTVQIKQVDQALLPKLDADFAGKLGMKSHADSDFLDEARKPLEHEKDALLQRILKVRLFDELISKNKKLPFSNFLFYNNLKRSISHLSQEDQKIKLALQPNSKDPIAKRALKQSQLYIILMKLRADLGIELNQEKLVEHVRQMASQYQDSAAFIQWFQQDKAQIEEAKAQVIEQQVVEAALEKIQVKSGNVLKSLKALKELTQKEEGAF